MVSITHGWKLQFRVSRQVLRAGCAVLAGFFVFTALLAFHAPNGAARIIISPPVDLSKFDRIKGARSHINILTRDGERIAIEKFRGGPPEFNLKPRIARNTIMYELAEAGKFRDVIASSTRAHDGNEDVLIEEYIPFIETRFKHAVTSFPADVKQCFDAHMTKNRDLSILRIFTSEQANFRSLCRLLIPQVEEDLRKLALIGYLTFQRDFHLDNILLHYDRGGLHAIGIDFESSMYEGPKTPPDTVNPQLPFYFDAYTFPDTPSPGNSFSDTEIALVNSWRFRSFAPILMDNQIPDIDIEAFQRRLEELQLLLASFPNRSINDLTQALYANYPIYDYDHSLLDLKSGIDFRTKHPIRDFDAMTTVVKNAIERVAVPTKCHVLTGRTLSGTGANDSLTARGRVTQLLAGAGDDNALGGKHKDCIALGKGNDKADGNGSADLMLGGNGNDRLAGGRGNDELIGGSGRDTLSGGPGNDTLDARDNLPSGNISKTNSLAARISRDRVNCGSGHDIALADRNDHIAENCEDVRYSQANEQAGL